MREGRNAWVAQRAEARSVPAWQFTLENCQEPLTLPLSPARCSRHLTYAGSTLLHAGHARNEKLRCGCAKTVEDEDSLWKPQEKCGKTP